METELVIKLPEELSQRAQAQASRQGTTVEEVVKRLLEEFAANSDKTVGETKPKAKFVKIDEVDLNRRLTPEEVAESLIVLKELQALGERISQNITGEVDAVAMIKDVRREL